MAAFSFGTDHPFPAGTVVYAYQDFGYVPGDHEPPGTYVATATVTSGQVLTVAGLTEGTDYWVVGQIAGEWRWVRAHMHRTPEVDPNSPLGAHMLDTTGVHGIPDTSELGAAGYHAVYARMYGVTADGTTDDHANLMTAVAAAQVSITLTQQRSAVVILPPGAVRTSDETVLPTLPCVSLEGPGMLGSAIHPLTDFGPGKYTVRWDSPNLSLRGEVKNLRILGPTDSAWSLANPIQMHGIRSSGGSRLHRVHVSDFNRGIEVVENHNVITECASQQNRDGLYIGNSTSFGDQYFELLDLNPNYRSNIAVAGGGSLDGAILNKIHMGSSAYGWFKETVTTKPGIMNSCKLDHVSIEGFGNAIVGCETTHEGDFVNNEFINLYVSRATGLRIAGEPVEYLFDCANFSNNEFRAGSDGIVNTAPGETLAIFNVATFFDNDFELDGSSAATFLAEGIPLVVPAADCSVESRVKWTGGVESILVKLYTSPCTTGQVMQWVRNNLTQPFDNTAGGQVSGVAQQDLAAADWLIMARKGVLDVDHAADADIATNAGTVTNYQLVADTGNTGCCKPGSSGQLLGRSAQPQYASTSKVKVRLELG